MLRIVFGDRVKMRVGDIIGQGRTRTVYALLDKPEWCLKVGNEEALHSEFRNQGVIEKAGLGRWIAPCEWRDGHFMMRRTSPASRDNYPASLPAIFVDLKYENWGMLDGRLICHDYALVRETSRPAAVRSVKWKES